MAAENNDALAKQVRANADNPVRIRELLKTWIANATGNDGQSPALDVQEAITEAHKQNNGILLGSDPSPIKFAMSSLDETPRSKQHTLRCILEKMALYHPDKIPDDIASHPMSGLGRYRKRRLPNAAGPLRRPKVKSAKEQPGGKYTCQ